MVDLNVTWLGFVFILNSFVCFSFHSFLEKIAEDGGGSFRIGRPRSRG